MLDEKFYNAVKKMIEEEGDLPNAIHRLIDDDKYNALPYESRERYVLEVANKYREAKERYYKERENEQRKKQEEDFRRQEEERKRVEQEKLKLEETKRKEKIRRKEEAKRKREEGIRRLQFEHGAIGSEVNEKRNKFDKQSNSEELFTKYSGCSETVNFVNNIEREEKEKLSKIFGKSSPGFENKFINNSGLGLDSLFCRFDSIIFLDTETTGLDSRNDRLIELAAIKVVREECNLQIAREMDSFIKLPEGMKLDKQIIELTGITNEDLLFKGKESKFVFQQFATMLAEEKTLLVAYNAQFDLNFIYWGLFREGLTSCLKDVKVIDAMTIYKDRRPYPHKLINAIQEYELSNIVSNSHRAIDDTKALFEVVKAMSKEYDDLDKYINLFGYNPKYGINGAKINSVTYLPQPYNSYKKIYETI